MRYAILIDAGFLKRKLDSRVAPIDAARVAAFLGAVCAHEALIGMTLHRVLWYDAPPLETHVTKPLLGGRIDFGSTALARSNAKLLGELCELPYVSVRRGDLVFRGWKIRRGKLPAAEPFVTLTAEDLEPYIQQKGVDMRLGLDIASLTLKAHVNVMVLVTGDSDFVPAMKFARREGAQIFLVLLGHAIRADMREHSDLILDLMVPEQSPSRSLQGIPENSGVRIESCATAAVP